MTTQAQPRLAQLGGGLWRGMSSRQRFFFRILLAFIATFGLYNAFGFSLFHLATRPVQRAWDALSAHFAAPPWMPSLSGVIPEALAALLPGTVWLALLGAFGLGVWLFLRAKLGRAATYTLTMASAAFTAQLCYVPDSGMPAFASFSSLIVWLIALCVYLGIFFYVGKFLWKGLGWFGRTLALFAVLLILLLFIGQGWVTQWVQALTFLQVTLLAGMGFGLYKANLDRYAASTPNVQQVNVGEPEDDPLVSHEHH